MNTHIPILTYHQVATNSKALYPLQSVEPKTFALQMKVLKILGFNTIDLDQLYNYRLGQCSIPKNPVVITFDDGYTDSIDNSVDVLKSFGFTAIYYIPTGYIGKSSSLLIPELGFDLPIIDWEKIDWLESNGFHVGCHSVSHPHLDQIPKDDCMRELRDSKNTLERRIGREVKHLAYPYGSYDDTVIAAAQELGFLTACTTDVALCKPKYKSLALPRVNIGYEDNMIDFVCKLYSGFNPDRAINIAIRKILNRIRVN